MRSRRQRVGPISGAVCLLLPLLLGGCDRSSPGQPRIELTNVPPVHRGGTQDLDVIRGRVTGANNDHRVVLYARSGEWYVQPYADQPFTAINADSTFHSPTHLGTEYAALLVERDYVPPSVTVSVPTPGGGVLAIVIRDGRPPFWRTWWFGVFLSLITLGVLLSFYRWQLHEVSKQLNLRFEARLAERTRIAQDLHDTLLQGLVSASMQLHVANDNLASDSPAKPMVGRVMQLMTQVIEEGRDAVRGLRSTSGNADDLETAFSQIGQEFGNEEVKDYRIIVEGTPRQLHPLIRDEAYRIGREALVNAFHHAQA